MSRALFSLNPDLAGLRSEGYFMRIQGSLLVMLEVPYVDAPAPGPLRHLGVEPRPGR
jgi:hypothetical protein